MKEHGGRYRILLRVMLGLLAVSFTAGMVSAEKDPLPCWNSGPAKKAIVDFVKATTQKSSTNYVESNDRIATFGQEGMLSTEHLLYAQAMFAFARLGQMAEQHSEWKDKLPINAGLEHDTVAMGKFTEQDWMEIIAVTHAGMGTGEFQAMVIQSLATAKHRYSTGPARTSSINPCWKC